MLKNKDNFKHRNSNLKIAKEDCERQIDQTQIFLEYLIYAGF